MQLAQIASTSIRNACVEALAPNTSNRLVLAQGKLLWGFD
jgi:hypothetical protein